MEPIIGRLIAISTEPGAGDGAFQTWIEQDDFIRLLESIPNSDHLILYALTRHTFLYGVLVPAGLVTPPDVEDLDGWPCDPYSSWNITIAHGKRPRAFLSPPLDRPGSRALARGEQIIFARSFDGRQEKRSYIEMSQRLTHAFGLHYVPERDAYCRFDRRGDIEDIVKIVEAADGGTRDRVRVVTIDRKTLDEYLALTKQAFVLFFDSTRCSRGAVWQGQTVAHHQREPEIYYRMGRVSGTGSYVRGFQIVRSRTTAKDIFRQHGIGASDERHYTSFIADDWKHGTVHECSCDPEQLGNYFVASDLPYGTSPAFFRPEVLQKYKADSDKYELKDRSINCRHAWHLQTYDINEAGQVHTYLKYLGNLPYEEQLYWKSFNEAPKAPISRRAFTTDFEGNFDKEYDPLLSLRQALRTLQEAGVPWWTPREEALFEKVHYPVTSSAEEWANEIHSLDKLLVEGFEISELRRLAEKLDRVPDKRWGSLKLADEVLRGLGFDADQVAVIVGPLQELHRLRTKLSGHASGAEAQKIRVNTLKSHKTYGAHFRNLCTLCDRAIRTLRGIFKENI